MHYRKFFRVFVLIPFFVLGILTGLSSGATENLRQKKIISDLDGFTMLKGYCADIYYMDGLAEYARTVARISECYYPALMNDFSVETPGRIKFIIYADSVALYKSLGIDYGNKPPMGVYYAGLIHILSPENWAGDSESGIMEAFVEEGPIIHEMAHFMLDKKTGGNFSQWFSEGTALYYEYKYTGYEWRKDISVSTEDLSFEDMEKFFNLSEEALAYRAAFEKVREIVINFGEEGLKDVYGALETGKSPRAYP